MQKPNPVYEVEIIFDTENDEYLIHVLDEQGIPTTIDQNVLEHILNTVKSNECGYTDSEFMS